VSETANHIFEVPQPSTHISFLPLSLPPSLHTYLVGQTERTDVLLVLDEQLHNVVLKDVGQGSLVLQEGIHTAGLVKRLIGRRVQAEDAILLRKGLVQPRLRKRLSELVELAVGLDGLEDIDLGVPVVDLAGVVVAAGLDHGGEGRGGGGGHACRGKGRGRDGEEVSERKGEGGGVESRGSSRRQGG